MRLILTLSLSFYLCLSILGCEPKDQMIDICDRGPIGESIVKALKANSCKQVSSQAMAAIEVLDLSNQHLSEIPENAFLGLISVKTLYLYCNDLTKLTDTSFAGLTSLEHLNLSWNKIETLGAKTFQSLPKLRKLFLLENRLEFLSEDAFLGLSSFEYLEISKNPLSTISMSKVGIKDSVTIFGVELTE
jgi:Leucine-rich repeat (LRR) protein